MKKTLAIFILAITLIVTSCAQTNEEETINLSAKELANAALSAVEFPAMIEYSNEEIEQYMNIDLSDIEDISCNVQMMSAVLAEVIVIIPKEGKTDDVMKIIEDRQEYLQSQAAFYPAQFAAAEATLTGQKGNAVYLICHEQAKTAEEAILNIK